MATAMPCPTALAALYTGVSKSSSAMPTSSLQQTNDAAAMSATASDCVPPNEMADTHVATLLITVTFVVASAAFMSAPVAGVTERAVLTAATSAAIRQTVGALRVGRRCHTQRHSGLCRWGVKRTTGQR
eukprot:scaffold130330_cov63-Phaeocystis_antarctica.AAC.3